LLLIAAVAWHLVTVPAAFAHARESELDFGLLKGFTNPQAAREIRNSLSEYWSIRERLGSREHELDQSASFHKQDAQWREINAQRLRVASRFYSWVPADFFDRDGRLKFVDEKGRWKESVARETLGKPVPSRLEEALEREWLKLESEFPAVFKQAGAQVHYVISPRQASLRGLFVLLGDTSLLLVRHRSPRGEDTWKRYVIGSRAIPVPAQGLAFDSFGATRILVHPKKGAVIWRDVQN
jgi:hypothetical protein